MTTPRKISYGVLIATLVAAAWLHLGPLLLAVLFSYFALHIVMGIPGMVLAPVVLNYMRLEMSKISVTST